MKLFLKNCFLVLLCLYRSHQTTPFRGQGAKTSTEQGIKAITYIGSHYHCLLAKLLKLSHLMIKIKQISRPPFPPTHIFHQKVKSCLSFLASRFYSSRYSGQDFVSCFSNLKPRFSLLTSPFILLTSSFILSPKVALTQSTGDFFQNPAPVVIYGEFLGNSPQAPIYFYTWPRYTGLGFIYQKADRQDIQLDNPDFFRGALPFVQKTFNISSQPYETPVYFSIRSDTETFTPVFLAFPGDSVMVRWDLKSHSVYFSGPQGAHFDLQYALHRLVANHEFSPAQNIIEDDGQEFLNRDDNRQKMEIASTQFGRFLHVVERGEGELAELERLISDRTLEKSARQLANAYKGIIQEDLISLYLTDALGKRSANLARGLLSLAKNQNYWENDPITIERMKYVLSRLWTLWEGHPSGQQLSSSGSLDFWFELTEATATLTQQDYFDWITALEEGYGKDLLLETYILRKGHRLPDFDQKAATAHILITDPGIRQNIREIIRSRTMGTMVSPVTLPTLVGGKSSLRDWKGEMVLVEFWTPGCGACLYFYRNVMQGLEKHFSDRKGLRLVSVAVDRDPERWKKNGGKYFSPSGTNLLAEGPKNPLLLQLGINSFPSFVLIGKDARILKASAFPNPDLATWIDLLETSLENEFHHQTNKFP